ncbi:MAG: hypothetical protein WBX01_14635 [Nitrososphaeraceae archaeon]
MKNWKASFLGSQKHNASFEDDDLIAPVPLIHAAQFLADDCPNKSLPRLSTKAAKLTLLFLCIIVKHTWRKYSRSCIANHEYWFRGFIDSA